ncbi:MAG: YihY/virulence factor BrkB family protein [Bacillus sp. (in: firmicutes)]
MQNKFVLGGVAYITRLMKRVKGHDVSGMAAQLAFFFLLSLFPLLLFLVTLLPYLPVTTEDILSLINDYIPGDSIELIEEQLNHLMVGSGGVLSFGIIATLWSASNGMNAVHKALNRAYGVEDKHTFLVTRILAVGLTLALIFVFMIALLLPVFGQQIGEFLFSLLGIDSGFQTLWTVLRWIISALILFIVFCILYWMVPYAKNIRRKIVRGALFATVGWIAVSFGFSFYVNNFSSYTATYGSIGSVIVLMLWFYLSAHIIIIGGELNAMASEEKEPV